MPFANWSAAAARKTVSVTYTTAKLSETIRTVTQNWPTYIVLPNSRRKILTTQGELNHLLQDKSIQQANRASCLQILRIKTYGRRSKPVGRRYWKGCANLPASKAPSFWLLFSFNKTCNMRNKFCVVSSISMFCSFPIGYITSTHTRGDLSCPQPSINTTQESVGATADIIHVFDWHGPTLLAMRLQCDEDTIHAIRRGLPIASVFHQT